MNIPFFMSFLLAIMDFLYGFVPGTAFRQDMLSVLSQLIVSEIILSGNEVVFLIKHQF
jgi:hypothetical protein